MLSPSSHSVPFVFQQKKQCAPVLEQSLSAGKLSPQRKEPILRDKISPNKVEQPSHNKPGTVFACFFFIVTVNAIKKILHFLMSITNLIVPSVLSKCSLFNFVTVGLFETLALDIKSLSGVVVYVH